ncbi:MAG TPA: glycerate kinase, partial [Longimicrobiales bacterium]|nr:glycerate kinase [Longimicrobiales bacterium]
EQVSGPLGEPVQARLLRRGELCMIESADACGLHLVDPAQRNPLRASTYGVGELLRAAARTRATHITIGLGGSATIDAGLGLAAALGWKFKNANGLQVEPIPAAMPMIASIEAPATAWRIPVTALADVRSPLFGVTGAARVFGPQKGADARAIEQLDRGLEQVARVVERTLGVSLAGLEGGGAAGGLGAGIHVFLNAQLLRGAEWVLEQLHFDRLLNDARLVVTGEGSFDAQSSLGKITGEVIDRALARAVPVLLIAGSIKCAVATGVHALSGHGASLTEEDLTHFAEQASARLLRH